MDALPLLGTATFWILAGLGHLTIWVAIFNRVHSTAIEHFPKKVLERVIYLAVLLIASLVVLAKWPALIPAQTDSWLGWLPLRPWQVAADVYLGLSVVAACLVMVRWLLWQVLRRPPGEFRLKSSRRIHLQRDHDARASTWCGDTLTCAMTWVPKNQILDLEVNEKELVLERLPESFDGWSIAHVSDFHLTGRMTQAFYEAIARLVSDLDCDCVVLSGDVIDKARCLGWLEPVFGGMRARESRFFILGNHDRRIRDDRLVRERMVRAGWEDLSEGWRRIEREEARVLWAGNELPWYRSAEQLDRPVRGAQELRILVSHSPDQIVWAVKRDFDLVLAGHTHGGQIRPPMVGPIISPSRFGPKFASGEFRVANTWMHVSRGVAGTHPIRWNCSPEITRLVLRRPRGQKLAE